MEIGDYCSISAGVHIYTHHAAKWSTSFGKDSVEKSSTTIGDGVYIGPNTVIQMGVNIGDKAVIGAMSFVNKDIPNDGKWYGISIR